VNWVPLLPNFADIKEENYRSRIEQYKDLGINILRVWGGSTLERECFYDLCDEAGIMVWQEFPLSSSGIDNWPPEDEESIEEMAKITESYIKRRQHHVSLTIWCGGNELQGGHDGSKEGTGKPVDFNHPMMAWQKSVVGEYDPTRRFLATSPSGPMFYAEPQNFGKGLHWHVHGPWKAAGPLDEWKEYWENDDSGFRSETGSPGTCSADMIRKYAGEYDPMPPRNENPLWRRTSVWWNERDQFVAENGREPQTLEEYVEWSQERQKEALCTALRACKNRFPSCGGFIIWMGHDCFPCIANTAIIDFEGNLKPAAIALREIFRGNS
jgi:beta-mannosidase